MAFHRADEILCRNRVISPQQWSNAEGKDPKEVQADWQAFDETFPDLNNPAANDPFAAMIDKGQP